jgi:hypothetical protein
MAWSVVVRSGFSSVSTASRGAELCNQRPRRFVFDVLCDSFELHDLGHLGDGCNHRLRNTVFGDVADEAAVDFQCVNLEIFQVGERTQAGTEVVQRNAASTFAQLIDKTLGFFEI